MDPKYPFIVIGMLSLVASTAGLFLPETLYRKSPDTLAEACVFGKDQEIWSIPHKCKDEASLRLKE